MDRGGFGGRDRWGGWGFAFGNGNGFPGRSDGGGGSAGGELLLSLQPKVIRLIGGKTGCFPEQISPALQRFQRDDGGGWVHRRWWQTSGVEPVTAAQVVLRVEWKAAKVP